jgi:hypothetical protein
MMAVMVMMPGDEHLLHEFTILAEAAADGQAESAITRRGPKYLAFMLVLSGTDDAERGPSVR